MVIGMSRFNLLIENSCSMPTAQNHSYGVYPGIS